MKQAIIKQMTEVVRDVMTSFQSDFFKCDMEILKSYDERFLWFVAPSHTYFAKIGEQYLNGVVSTEEGLYATLQRTTMADACLAQSPGKRELVFYYDGDKLEKIDRKEAAHLWEAVRSWSLHNWQVQNGMRELPKDFGIPIRFSCPLSYVKEQLAFAKEIGTDTLLNAFRRFRQYYKTNSSHKCVIGRDFAKHSFSFAFIYTDSKTGEEKCSLNGRLIYYDGVWNTHT